jgi:hypothetical protein
MTKLMMKLMMKLMTFGFESRTKMRLLAVAVAAAFAAGAVCTADAAPRKKPPVQAQPAGAAYVPISTYVMHRDEQGRTRTKILVQKRSYLDGGTEVMPGDVVTNQSNLINSMYYSPSSSSVSNHGIAPPRAIPDPFFLPGKNNPFFN